MHSLLKIRCMIITLLILITIILATSNNDTSTRIHENEVSSAEKEKSYMIKLLDSKVSLYESNTVIKEYDINPGLLPGEDILLLSNGIVVKSISEADSIAEDFDG